MPYSEECVRQAATFSILPPIESTRITTKDAITFKYGMIQVRAKLPLGDWIVPGRFSLFITLTIKFIYPLPLAIVNCNLIDY